MNELKELLLKVALNIKAQVKNIIVKIFLQPEMNSDSSEEVYFMLRISEIANEDQLKSYLENSQVKFFNNLQASNLDHKNQLDHPQLNHNRVSNDF